MCKNRWPNHFLLELKLAVLTSEGTARVVLVLAAVLHLALTLHQVVAVVVVPAAAAAAAAVVVVAVVVVAVVAVPSATTVSAPQRTPCWQCHHRPPRVNRANRL
jgi:hypothetical protein